MTNADPTIVARLSELEVGSLRLARVDGQRICLARTEEGVFAVDHACPHEGYGLTQGSLTDGVLTCAWHNWKFRVSDGACLVGEEDVRTHHVSIDDSGNVQVRVRERDPEAETPVLMASLRRGIERDYIGQVSRDVVRLLRASANPGELVWEAVAYGAPRAEFGWGHSIAVATDCLAMVELYEGDQRALPIVQGIAGTAEEERGRPVNPLPAPLRTLPAGAGAGAAFRAAVETEQIEEAQALVLGALEHGFGPDDMRAWFTAVVSDHHLSYGHGAIYAQKAFQLLDLLGWERAGTVLAHLVPTIIYGTREDTLPYMRPFLRGLEKPDFAALASIAPERGWDDGGRLLEAVLNGTDRAEPARAALAALRRGAGVEGVLDVVTTAVAERMLRYDVATERDFHDDFGWLDITHGITYANAARWHHREAFRAGDERAMADAVRLALFTVFQAHWTGRHEWHTAVGPRAEVERHDDLKSAGDARQREALMDGTSRFIVHAHAVKTSRAAAEEALTIGSPAPLDAVARFLSSPRQERFVAANVVRSIDFLSGRVHRE